MQNLYKYLIVATSLLTHSLTSTKQGESVEEHEDRGRWVPSRRDWCRRRLQRLRLAVASQTQCETSSPRSSSETRSRRSGADRTDKDSRAAEPRRCSHGSRRSRCSAELEMTEQGTARRPSVRHVYPQYTLVFITLVSIVGEWAMHSHSMVLVTHNTCNVTGVFYTKNDVTK